VRQLIEAQNRRGIPTSNIFLAGFSQGAAMTYSAGLTHPDALAGLIVLSGYVPSPSFIDSRFSASNCSTPIFAAHGIYDDVLPIQLGEAARDFAITRGCKVDWSAYSIPHSVCEEEIHALRLARYTPRSIFLKHPAECLFVEHKAAPGSSERKCAYILRRPPIGCGQGRRPTHEKEERMAVVLRGTMLRWQSPNGGSGSVYGTSSSYKAQPTVVVRHCQLDRGESIASFQRRCHAYRAISNLRVRC
jgi:hypothetical protein